MANRLPELRKAQKLTQVALAEKSGVARSVIARFEAGITGISTRNLMKICKTLECRTEDVIQEDDDGEAV